jgi:outer membrane protein assembly factor BamB
MPTISNGRLYVGSGELGDYVPYVHHSLYELNALTGKKLWNYTFEGIISGPPLIIGDTIFVGVSYVTLKSPSYGAGWLFALQEATITVEPSPSVPELSWLVILPLLLCMFSVALIGRHRKNTNHMQI